VLLAVLSLSACLPRPLPRVLKIGLGAPFEGRYRAIGYDAVYAARLAVREINERGRIPGYRLALVAYDDRADPSMARANAEALVTDPAVIAVIGHYRQRTTEAAGAVYGEVGMPMIAVGGWLTSTDRGVWHLAPARERLAEALLRHTVAFDRVALAGEGPLRSDLDRLASRGPLPSVVSLSYEGDPPAVDAVISLAESHEAASALDAWRAAGWEGARVGTTDLGASAFRQIAGTAAAGTRFVTPYPRPHDIPNTEAWIDAYRHVGPHVPEPSYYALPTYEAVHAVAEAVRTAVEQGEHPGRAVMVTALSDVSRTGSLGTLRWSPDGYWADVPLHLYVWESEGPRRVAQEP
jgi:ABC-type branched-subunit amino acid transport system substrate-binding protein